MSRYASFVIKFHFIAERVFFSLILVQFDTLLSTCIRDGNFVSYVKAAMTTWLQFDDL